MQNFTDSLIQNLQAVTESSYKLNGVIHQLKRCVLDWIGVCNAGASMVGNRMNPMVSILGEGKCSTFLSDDRKDVVSAASINGFLAHVMELDDGHRFGMLHLEAPIISAMIAVSQQENLNFEKFLKGVVAGYQTTVQVARYIQPYHKQRGYHATGTCGTLGVAAAIATAMDYSKEEFENALAAAATRAAGLLTVIDAPSEMKPFNVFGAVEAGIRAAYLAKSGFVGPIDPMMGKRGFLKVYVSDLNIEKLPEIKMTPEILNIYFKPYVSCRHCHAPAEAALNIRSKNNFSIEEIQSILIETYKLAIGGHDSTEIDSVTAAKMSIPYCVAVSLFRGSCALNSFSKDVVKNTVLQTLVRKVNVIEDPELTLLSPGKRGAKMTITLNNGKTITDFVENPLGEPEHPMSDSMLENKYFELMKYAGIDDEKAEILKEMVWGLENNFDAFLSEL